MSNQFFALPVSAEHPQGVPVKEANGGSPDIRHAMYLTEPMMRPRETLEAAIKKLEDIEFDAIACCGVSGLLVAPTIAMEMGKRLAVVRKMEDKDNHSTFRVEATMHEGDKWIFLDDLVATGGTLKYVRRHMESMGFDHEVSTYTYSDMYLFDSWKRHQVCMGLES